jgi:hypothetical protein
MILLKAIPYIIAGVIVFYFWSFIWDILVGIQLSYGILVVIIAIIAFMLLGGAIEHWNKKG